MSLDNQTVPYVNVGRLPCMPHILLKLLASDESEPDRFWLQAVAEDPVLTTRVVSAWRATAANANDAPASMARAIAALGLEKVRVIVRNAAIQQVFGPFNNCPTTELKKHWWRAITCANLAEMLAIQITYPYPEEARLAGILCALDPLAQWAATLKNNGANEADATDDQHNNSSQHIASDLAREWRLHAFLIDAIYYRHASIEQLTDTHPLVRIVHLANSLASYLTEAGDMPVDAAKLFFGLASHDLNRISTEALHAGAETAQKFGIEFEHKAPVAFEPTAADRRQYRHTDLRAAESTIDAEIRRNLPRAVRDLALLNNLYGLLNEPYEQSETLSLCSQNAQILFGLAPPIYFVRDQAQKLRAHPLPGQDPRMRELMLSTQSGSGLAAESVHRQIPLNSLAARTGTVLERQLTQLLSSSGVLYLPFMVRGTLSALAVFGIEPHQLPRLEKQQQLLCRFGFACAQALQASVADRTLDVALLHEKLTAMQTQVKRVAHEVNNPLSIMKNYIKLIALKLEDDADVMNDLRIFSEEIDRVSLIVRGLKPLTTLAPAAVSDIDINGVIRDLIGMLTNTLFTPAKISVKMHLAENLPPISSHRDKLKQILLNLLKNAVEAMPDGGIITVTTWDNVNRDGRPYIEVMVSDTGPGISAEMMTHLFEPVISTKGGDHAGLGLAIVHQLIKEIDASITCISERSGLAFHLLIPKTVAAG